MASQKYNEEFYKEITIVQNIIDRMAKNSFMIKGWTVTLVVVSLLVEGEKIHYAIAFIPSVMFWALDTYYLRQERCYRKLYEWLLENRPDNQENMFDMKAETRFGKEVGWSDVLFSSTIFCFYITIIVLVFLVNHFFQ